MGAVLMQQGKPLAFFSQALSDRGRLKPVYERELMAIVLEVQKWRYGLLGSHFITRTDHKSLKYLLEKRLLDGEQQKNKWQSCWDMTLKPNPKIINLYLIKTFLPQK